MWVAIPGTSEHQLGIALSKVSADFTIFCADNSFIKY